MSHNPFVPLHLLSNYSLLYGANHIEELVAHAASQGIKTMALTDRNNVYGLHLFLEACKKHHIKPVIGARLEHKGERLICLTRNYQGFSRLTETISALHDQRNERHSLVELISSLDSNTIVIADRHLTLTRLLKETALRDNPPIIAVGLPAPHRALALEAARHHLPLVALPEIVAIQRADYHLHRVLRAIDTNSAMSNLPPGALAPSDALFPSPGTLSERFAIYPEAIEATASLAALCETSIYNGLIFPKYNSPVATPDLLRRLALDGCEERYGELSEGVLKRLDYELELITRKGFADYFLVVRDIVSKASRICGRGSGAASLVAYALGITNVDPIRHKLYFERFLNNERDDPPDIDIDFAWDERDAIIEQVMAEHGKRKCAMVCNHIHFKPRSALREVAKTHGIPDGEIKKMRHTLAKLAQADGESPFSRRFYPHKARTHPLEEPWPHILAIAKRLTGFPRHLGVHVGGLIITPRPIDTFVPVETATKGVPVITWEKDGAEEAGFVKIDLLGNRSLAVVRDAVANVKANGHIFEQRTWDPLTDTATISLLASGNTMGVFYVESPAMRQLQRKTGRGDFEHLVIHSSIIRPAANRFIAKYVERLSGAPYDPLHPLLDRILAETYGIMCYQEDVSKAAIALAGFSSGEADGLRKILSKKNRALKLAQYKQMFFDGAQKKGVPRETVEEIWTMILSFDGYSFCKPHSASFAMVSFQSAYMKAHFPAEFMAAVLTNQGGFYTPLAYISEAQRMGLAILPPHINNSDLAYKGNGAELQVGLMAIAELKRSTIVRILSERDRGGPFSSLEEFLTRVAPPPADLEILVSTGTLDPLASGRSHPEQLWTALMRTEKKGATFSRQTGDLFSDTPAPPPIPHTTPLSYTERQRAMYRYLGYLCDGHPLQFYSKRTRGIRHITPAARLHEAVGRKVSMVGWPVTRKTVLTAAGQPMQFVSFEDESAIYETVLFPDAFDKYGDTVAELRPFIIQGTVESEQGATYVQVERVRKIPAPDPP